MIGIQNSRETRIRKSSKRRGGNSNTFGPSHFEDHNYHNFVLLSIPQAHELQVVSQGLENTADSTED